MRALLAGLVTLAVASPALAGGWATVELSSTPDGLAAGQTWNVDVRVLQHGRTPLEDVQPAVIVTDGERRVRTAARPTGRAGVYRAAVSFPSAGTWRYVVDDGFTQRHTYPPVEIGPGEAAATPAPAPDGNEGIGWTAIVAALAAGLGAAGLAFALQRRRLA